MEWYQCKCGHEEELESIEEAICPLCKRIGCWMPEEENDELE